MRVGAALRGALIVTTNGQRLTSRLPPPVPPRSPLPPSRGLGARRGLCTRVREQGWEPMETEEPTGSSAASARGGRASPRPTVPTIQPRTDLPEDIQAAVQALHAAKAQAVLYIAGGGALAVADLMCVSGASNTVLEVQMPYSQQAMAQLLGGHPPEQIVCVETGRRLARVAFKRAVALTPVGTPIVGLAATCALVSDSPKRGQHRCYVVAHTATQVLEYSLTLHKGARSRLHEDALVSRLVLQALADASHVGLGSSLVRDSLTEGDVWSRTGAAHADALDMLLSGQERLIEVGVHGVLRGATRGRIVLPGSFNPIHEGHSELLQAAAALRPGRIPAFELSVTNADKGCLPRAEVLARIQQFVQPDSPAVICTDAPLYVAKARLMNHTTFVIGMDTAKRLVMPKYYNDSREMMVAALAEIKSLHCDFLVGGRLTGGVFEELDGSMEGLEVPRGLEGLFQSVPDFRKDISSSELRAQGVTLPAATSL